MLWVCRMVQDGFHRDVDNTRKPDDPPPLDDIPDDVWAEVVDALALLRSAYAGAHGPYLPEVFDLWRVSQLCSSLPWYFTVRQSTDPRITTPAYAPALARTVRRTSIKAQRAIGNTMQGEASHKLSLYSIARMSALGVEAQQIASASPTGATPIVQGRWHKLAQAFISGTPQGIGRVPELAGALDAILLFGASYTGLERVMWQYHCARRFLYHDLVASIGATPELTTLLAEPVEPLDHFIVEPPAPASMPYDQRETWFARFAELAVPLALDSSDAVIRDVMRRIATAMGVPRTGDPVTHVLDTFDTLDTLFGEALAFVEYGLRRAALAPATTEPFDASVRDRVVRNPRAYLASLRR